MNMPWSIEAPAELISLNAGNKAMRCYVSGGQLCLLGGASTPRQTGGVQLRGLSYEPTRWRAKLRPYSNGQRLQAHHSSGVCRPYGCWERFVNSVLYWGSASARERRFSETSRMVPGWFRAPITRWLQVLGDDCLSDLSAFCMRRSQKRFEHEFWTLALPEIPHLHICVSISSHLHNI